MHLADLLPVDGARACERCVPAHAVPTILGRRARIDVIRDPNVVKDLHRAHVQEMRARNVGLEISPLEQDEVDSCLREQQRGR
jgi:hypothetical protein